MVEPTDIASTPATPDSAPSGLARVLALLQRYPWLLPLVSFLFGWTSYVLVERGEHMARAIAALALLGWPWLLAESLLGQWLHRRTSGALAVGAVRYLTQSVQLEILFFALPFLIGATQFDAGHFAFTAVAAVAALVCSIDPLYSRYVAERPFVSVIFQAWCNFIGALVVLPLAARLSLEYAVPLAFAITGALLLVSLPRALAQAGALQRVLRLLLLAAAPAGLWLLRAEIPAAGLRVSDARITQTVSDSLEPGPALENLSAANLVAEGAVAFIAVRAPAGLSQSVEFVWTREGEVLDHIGASISGGREAGYRIYSRKHAFPEDPRGRWQVDLRTPQGQLICRLRFAVD